MAHCFCFFRLPTHFWLGNRRRILGLIGLLFSRLKNLVFHFRISSERSMVFFVGF